MANQTRPQAKKGGEVGTNGEFYRGGLFLPSTEKPKRHGSVKFQGKKEIAPYVWEVPPAEGFVSLFVRFRDFIDKNTGKALIRPCEFHRIDPEIIELYHGLYKEGYRWIEEESAYEPYLMPNRELALLKQGEEFDVSIYFP